MNSNDTNNSDTNKPLSAIDRALATARKRKAARAGAIDGSLTLDESTETSTPKVKAKRVVATKASSEEAAATKAAKDAEKAAAKAAKAAERETKRAAKAAEREAAKANKAPAHMKKVEKARSKLPPMTDATSASFGEITANLSAVEIATLALHLQMHNRATATIRATGLDRLPMDAIVTITGGDPQYIGLQGRVIHSQKLRAKVAVDGFTKPVYIYNGEASVVSAVAESTGTNG